VAEYTEILGHLRELLRPYVQDEQAAITPETRLVEDLGLDSVQAMEVIQEVEDRFDAAIPINFLPEVHKVDDLVRELERLLP